MNIQEALNVLGANSGVTRQQRRQALKMVNTVLELQRKRIRHLQDEASAEATIEHLQAELARARREVALLERYRDIQREQNKTLVERIAGLKRILKVKDAQIERLMPDESFEDDV